MIEKKKILFLVTEDWYFLSHRLRLALFLIKKGYEVHVCCKNTGKLKEITLHGINCHEQIIRRKSLSILNFLKEAYRTYFLIKEINPSILHLISLRPIVLGFFISTFGLKAKICCTFTGLGTLFISNNVGHLFMKNIIKLFLMITYRINNAKIIVQNNDDANYIAKFFFEKQKRFFLIKGSGIDTKFFKFKSEPKNNKHIILAYTGRLLKDKGVHWLIQAFLLAKKEIKNLSLILAGSWDNNNPSSLSEGDFKKLKQINGIHYLGNVRDVRKVWEKAHIAILLSKREGLPLGLIEAAAVGRSIIATDVPGCREIVKDNVNGYTVR